MMECTHFLILFPSFWRLALRFTLLGHAGLLLASPITFHNVSTLGEIAGGLFSLRRAIQLLSATHSVFRNMSLQWCSHTFVAARRVFRNLHPIFKRREICIFMRRAGAVLKKLHATS
jgi:hypothetical protein